MVASSDIIRKRDLFLGVDVAAETAFFVAGRASVPCRRSLIGLENESVCVHRFSKKYACIFCVTRILEIENAENAESAGVKVWNNAHASHVGNNCLMIPTV